MCETNCLFCNRIIPKCIHDNSEKLFCNNLCKAQQVRKIKRERLILDPEIFINKRMSEL